MKKKLVNLVVLVLGLLIPENAFCGEKPETSENWPVHLYNDPVHNYPTNKSMLGVPCHAQEEQCQNKVKISDSPGDLRKIYERMYENNVMGVQKSYGSALRGNDIIFDIYSPKNFLGVDLKTNINRHISCRSIIDDLPPITDEVD